MVGEPEELAIRVAKMIENFAGEAIRQHDKLILPDANAKPVTLKSLFANPRELMAGFDPRWLGGARASEKEHAPRIDHRYRL